MYILLNKHQTFKLKKDIAQREFKIMNPLIPLVRGSKHIEDRSTNDESYKQCVG